jgi:diguanylate cyclase (GGDEF)-like protein
MSSGPLRSFAATFGQRSRALWHTLSEGRAFPQGDEAVTRAYASHLAHRVPLLYAVVLIDNAILAVRYLGQAPDVLTIWLPLLSSIVLGLRACYWLPERVARRSLAQVERALHSLTVVGPLVAFGCTIWALSLYTYGDPLQRSLVHYIVAITCFTSILGLGQSPVTAFRMAVASLGPATLWFLLHQHPNSVAVCAVQLVVSMLLLLVTYGYHNDFVALEASRQALAHREADAKRLAAALHTQATHDPLTGVANRRAILATLEAMLSDEDHPSPWLALADLDGFKHVNDTFGHAAGDAVLRACCDEIAKIEDLAAFGRLGGDEFAILLPGDLSSSEARDRLSDLIARISRPIYFEGHRLAVSASIGLHLSNRRSVNECLERADDALYKAKEVPGRVIEFGSVDERAMHERQAITRTFCSADLESQVSLVYQPIVDFDSKAVETFEALARWSPDGVNSLSPDGFIGLAESTGRIKELTSVVLRRAVTECPVWKSGKRLSVNLSALDLIDPQSAERLAKIVAAAQAPASHIVFEVTETALMADSRRAAENLTALRQLGFRIALDDFGTGQSSLARVHQLPLDQIKIDRSFAADLESDAAGRAVASTILALARQLGLACTIEGIENALQAASARALGIRSMQGYYFGRPMPVAHVLGTLAAA